MNAKFIKSAAKPVDWINDSTTEVVFVGRSNVGKSSLINALANAKIAITSKTPGRTQLANFYDFKSFRLVDLPGYGYAKISKSQQVSLVDIIDTVLMHRPNIFLVVQVIDANVITKEDIAMNKYLSSRFANILVVLNKADKSKINFYNTQKSKIAKFMAINQENMLFTSTIKKLNISELFKKITKIVKV
ncbi:MAG: YihA family ribosome biogenesis GTP-binding protein [Malacoplasma sp.]|nr:YihA family ribosome biogenesis GTP-binding protein [Malacoplasma sp.]